MVGLRFLRCSFCRLLARRVQTSKELHHPRLEYPVAVIHPALRNFSTTYILTKKSDDKDVLSPKKPDTVQRKPAEETSADSDSSDSSSDSSSSSDSDSDVESTDKKPVQSSDKDVSASKPSSALSDDFFQKLKQSEAKLRPSTKKGLQSIDKNIATAAKKVAKNLPGDEKQNEAELIGQLLSQYQTSEQQKAGVPKKSLSQSGGKQEAIMDLMKGFKKSRKTTSSSGLKETDVDNDSFQPSPDESPRKPTNFLKGKPLGIFNKSDVPSSTASQTSLFDVVAEERRQQRVLAYPPRNGFEEQIQWTLEGKMWTFPINNEAGWEEENSRGFHEHVFLEDQLEGFPRRGPIRHFMELVTTALSKNPYLTVSQKHEHIDWFRQYFIDKSKVLEDRLGDAGQVQPATQTQPSTGDRHTD